MCICQVVAPQRIRTPTAGISVGEYDSTNVKSKSEVDRHLRVHFMVGCVQATRTAVTIDS